MDMPCVEWKSRASKRVRSLRGFAQLLRRAPSVARILRRPSSTVGAKGSRCSRRQLRFSPLPWAPCMRFDHLRVVWPYLLGATLLVACDVDLREGWFRCDSHGACPEGWTCRDDGRCWSTPSDSKVEPATRPD